MIIFSNIMKMNLALVTEGKDAGKMNFGSNY